jgi:hypothetical protein
MAGFALPIGKNLLDWTTLAATPAQPAGLFLGLSLGSPTRTSASEASYSGYARATCLMIAAVTSGTVATCSNSSQVVFTFSTAAVVSGYCLFDAAGSSNSGVYVAGGLLSAVSSMVSGDILTFTTGACKMTLL